MQLSSSGSLIFPGCFLTDRFSGHRGHARCGSRHLAPGSRQAAVEKLVLQPVAFTSVHGWRVRRQSSPQSRPIRSSRPPPTAGKTRKDGD